MSDTTAKRVCTFCAIATNSVTADIVEVWSDALAFRPLDPVNAGHTLVVPRRHVADFAEDPAATAAVSARAAELVAGMGGECNVIANVGRLAGQSVFHLHLHVIPRSEGDGLLFPWSRQRKTSCGHPRDAHGPAGCVVVPPGAGDFCPCRYAGADMHREFC